MSEVADVETCICCGASQDAERDAGLPWQSLVNNRWMCPWCDIASVGQSE